MKSANIADLKNRLSHYLRFVRRGEAVLVRDRGTAIARLEPMRDHAALPGMEAERVRALVERGVLAPPRKQRTRAKLKARQQIQADLVAAVLAEREEER